MKSSSIGLQENCITNRLNKPPQHFARWGEKTCL
jgi:hypothetical protein